VEGDIGLDRVMRVDLDLVYLRRVNRRRRRMTVVVGVDVVIAVVVVGGRGMILVIGAVDGVVVGEGKGRTAVDFLDV
jgi:hypothetical protein